MLPILIAALSALMVVLLAWAIFIRPGLLLQKREKQFDKVSGGELGEDMAVDEKSLQAQLQAAGLNLGSNPEMAFWLISLVLGAAILGLLTMVNMPLPLAALGGGLGFYLPRWYLKRRAGQRGREIDQELPKALGYVIAHVRTDPSVMDALTTASTLLTTAGKRSPLAEELSRTVAERRALGVEGALRALQERSPSPSLSMLAFALQIFHRAGGEYTRTLAEQADGIRTIIEARGEARASAADAMLAAKAIPVILFGVLILMLQDPEYAAFYSSFVGQVLLIVAIGLMGVGYLLMESMVQEVA
jgi:tight adherence protein B